MAALDAQQLVALTRRFANEIDPRLHVARVMSTERGTAHAELVVSLAGCHRGPCALVLNIACSGAALTDRELAGTLDRAIAAHLSLP